MQAEDDVRLDRARGTIPAEDNAHVVGVWFGGLNIVPNVAGEEHEVFGLCGTIDRDLADIDGCTLLREIKIDSTFRSAREAAAAEAGYDKIQWFRATYMSPGWELVRKHPPARDLLLSDVDLCLKEPIGDGYTAVEDPHMLTLLPPPLRERGIAVLRMRVPDQAWLHAVFPRDRSTTLFDSWDEIERHLSSKWIEYMWLPHNPRGERWMRWIDREKAKIPSDCQEMPLEGAGRSNGGSRE